MAIKQINANRDFDIAEYIVDSSSDIQNLPMNIGWGSSALCIQDGTVYILKSNNTWVELGSNN